jgi:dTDP-glucose 4,6-dehydratase
MVSSLPGVGRAVVTGGAGFVGSWLCEHLVDLGVDVVCVDNLVTGSRDNVEALTQHAGFELLEQDVSAGLEVAGDVDWVLHLACPASPVDYLRLPVETLMVGSIGTKHALDLAERTGARRPSTRSPRRTGATSTRWGRAASTTSPSGSQRR